MLYIIYNIFEGDAVVLPYASDCLDENRFLSKQARQAISLYRKPETAEALGFLFLYALVSILQPFFKSGILLATHDVTWSRRDSFCEGQYEDLAQPEEFPTMLVKTQIRQLPKPSADISFAKFNFDEEDPI